MDVGIGSSCGFDCLQYRCGAQCACVDAPALVYASLAEGASVKAGDFTLK